MTRKEAIQIIKDRNFYCIECIDRSDKCCKALKIAIDSLEKEEEREAKELSERDAMLDDYYNTKYTDRSIL